LTLVSRVTGLARDMLLAWWLGNNWIQDSFNYAFRMPNLFRNLLGEGALSAAFVPLISGRLAREGRAAGGEFFNSVATALTVALVGATAAVLALIAGVYATRGSDPHTRLLLWLTATMTPYMIFVCLVALVGALLNCLDRFSWPAFMPVVLNMLQVAAMALAVPALARWLPEREQQVYVVAGAVLAAGVVQLVLMLWRLRREGFGWRWRWRPRDPDLRRLAVMMGPMVLGLGILQFGAWLDDQVIIWLTAVGEKQTWQLGAWRVWLPLTEGALSAVNQARRMYQFPVGVLAISLATAAFPAFSRYAAREDWAGLRGALGGALRLAVFEAVPASVGLIVLAGPIMRVVFERGRYTPADAAYAAHILRFYSLGIWAYCVQAIIVRGFYSLQDTLTPLRVMSKTVALAIAVNLTLIWAAPLGAAVFGLSTSVMASLNVVLLGRELGRRLPGVEWRGVLGVAARVAGASVAMGGAAWLAQAYLPWRNKYALLGACMGIGLVVFAGACRVLRIGEAGEFWHLARRGGRAD